MDDLFGKFQYLCGMDWNWLAFTPDVAQALSHLGVGAFMCMLLVASVLILTKPPQALMKGMILSAFGLCILVSLVTSTLWLWHHHYR